MTVELMSDDKYSVAYDLPSRTLVWKAFGRVSASYKCRKSGSDWIVLNRKQEWQHFATLKAAADFVMADMLAIVRSGQGEQT
jgi:hypothetical protein